MAHYWRMQIKTTLCLTTIKVKHKSFVGHRQTMKSDKGTPVVELQATWEGYPGAAPTNKKWAT